jgi:hypothetical protein
MCPPLPALPRRSILDSTRVRDPGPCSGIGDADDAPGELFMGGFMGGSVLRRAGLASPASRLSLLLAASLLQTTLGASVGTAAEKPIRFDRDIRPLLSEHCFACHGPGKQEAGLRLDDGPATLALLESGERAIVPGDTASSALIARIVATDPDTVMPPPHFHKELSEAQKDLLTRWIASGAPYEQHWSFRKIVRPEVPAAPGDPGNPIDRFLEARVAAEGLPLNAAADRPTLIRRVAFALTGLPPTPEEVAAFVADPAPDAYDKLVDRLLLSPHHGEEMARHWLDVSRYADTHGLHLDNERHMWAYRDWVVKAFNDNLPFDQFTILQLAGDLLPGATREQQTATGFSRCNVTTSEGGSINEELLFRYAVDRTATTLNAWMGLTGQCAVCHDHKFDPISAKDFYSLYAFFNSAADPGFDGNIEQTAPVIKLPTPEQETELAALDAKLPELEKRIEEAVANVVYVDPATADPKPAPVTSETVWLDDDLPAGAAAQSSPGGPTWFAGTEPGTVLSGARCLDRTASGIGQDVFMPAGEIHAGPAGGEVFAHVWIDPAAPPRAVMIQLHTDGWEHRAVWGEGGVIPWGAVGQASQMVLGPLPEAGKWVRVAFKPESIGVPPGTKIGGFALTQFDGHVRWDKVGLSSTDDPTTDPARSFAAWWKPRVGQEKLDDVPEPLRGLVREGPEKTTNADDVTRIRRHWLRTVWREKPEGIAVPDRELVETRRKRDDLEKALVRTFVFNDLPQMRDSFIMLRGAYNKPGEKVTRATPAFLPPLGTPEGATPNRLDLAKWILLPEQPLVARVAANRLWQQFFGTGLVKTSEDFGQQGETPSHPELLDWLAVEYRESGWNTRHVVKLLVTSRAFCRQASIAPEHQAADPENRLLAHGPRIRLDAEQIRDNALAVSGLLVPTLGGRGVRPYQPDNIWEPVGFAGSNTQRYARDTGPALWRRSLYAFVKRTAPPPFMVNFDAPNREQFCARRERSNTPLQALQLMNDVQHVEAARALATRALASGPADDAARIDWLFRAVIARGAESAELAVVAEELAAHRGRYAADSEAAKRLVALGESKAPENIPAEELAAWTLVSNMLLNLDETLSRN